MVGATSGRRDFFISFNSADRAWAEWIAYELEAAGYSTFFQHWDFAPGSNFVLEMQKAASQADKTIAVLSQNYLDALFTQPEWSAVFVQDPTGENRKLFPIKVGPCQPPGILAPIVYADLMDLSEDAARHKLLSAAHGDRPKPKHVSFPVPRKNTASEREFPGTRESGSPGKKLPSESTHDSRTAVPRKARRAASQPVRTWQSFVWFALALLGAVIIIVFGQKLVGFGLVNQIYYLVLVALGLGAAGSLFAGIRSVAKYRGQNSWGTLVLSGPPVVFCLVLGAGMYFAPGKGPFGLTVFVHGPGGPQDLILRNEGKVAIDLGPDRRLEQIGEKGSAFFPSIPPEYRGKNILVTVIADGFAQTNGTRFRLPGESLYVSVRKQDVRFSGELIDESHDPVSNAAVQVADRTTKTDSAGRFELSIPGELSRKEMTLDVRADGFVSQTHSVVPNSNEIRLVLRKRGHR